MRWLMNWHACDFISYKQQMPPSNVDSLQLQRGAVESLYLRASRQIFLFVCASRQLL